MFTPSLTEQLIADSIVDAGYIWVCKVCLGTSHNNNVWGLNHLRRAIKTTNQILAALKLTMHLDKTFIGWIKAGFDFLGYHINPETINNHRTL